MGTWNQVDSQAAEARLNFCSCWQRPPPPPRPGQMQPHLSFIRARLDLPPALVSQKVLASLSLRGGMVGGRECCCCYHCCCTPALASRGTAFSPCTHLGRC